MGAKSFRRPALCKALTGDPDLLFHAPGPTGPALPSFAPDRSRSVGHGRPATALTPGIQFMVPHWTTLKYERESSNLSSIRKGRWVGVPLTNVIENAEERKDTLKSAFGLARKALIVSVMLGYQRKRAQYGTYEDGVRTQRNTFQKYYTQDEFRTYVEATLEVNAIPVAPGRRTRIRLLILLVNPFSQESSRRTRRGGSRIETRGSTH